MKLETGVAGSMRGADRQLDEAAFGTGRRTAFRSFGTSYRLNSALVSWDDRSLSDSDSEVDESISNRATRGLTVPLSLLLRADEVIE